MSSNREVELTSGVGTAVGIGFLAAGAFLASGSARFVLIGLGGGILGLAQTPRARDRSTTPDPIRAEGPAAMLPSTLGTSAPYSAIDRFGDATPGYDQAQVADFLSRLQEKVDELSYRCRAAEEQSRSAEADVLVRRGTPLAKLAEVAAPSVTADRDPIGPVRFASSVHGWSSTAVDAFLVEIGAHIADLQDRYRRATSRWQSAEAQLAAIDPPTD